MKGGGRAGSLDNDYWNAPFCLRLSSTVHTVVGAEAFTRVAALGDGDPQHLADGEPQVGPLVDGHAQRPGQALEGGLDVGGARAEPREHGPYLGERGGGGGGQSTQPQHFAQRSTEMRDDLVRREDTGSYLHL